MTGEHWLAYGTYLETIERETRRFRDCLAEARAGTRVPSCPDWDVDDLLWHLGGGDVQHFWAWILAHRPEGPHDYPQPPRPGGRRGLLAVLDRAHDDLMLRLRNADPDEGAWSWAADPRLHTVAFLARRQAHEALIHRVDAELAVGDVTSIDPALAADGVEECLAVMYGEVPTWGRFAPDGARVAVELTDVEQRVVVGLGRFTGRDPEDGEQHDEDDLQVIGHERRGDVPERVDAVVCGTASDVDRWLWHRGGRDQLVLDGDEAVLGRLLAVLGQSID